MSLRRWGNADYKQCKRKPIVISSDLQGQFHSLCLLEGKITRLRFWIDLTLYKTQRLYIWGSTG